MAVDINLYSDRREVPLYSITMAAWCLGLSVSTLRSWVKGRSYQTKHGNKRFKPLIEPASSSGDTSDPVLSFFNLAEAHVLSAIRKDHRLNFKKIRAAIDFIAKEFPSRHPLVTERFFTNGTDLFIKALLGTRERHILNASRGGQFALKEMLDKYLERIDRDSAGLPIKVFPLVADSNEKNRVIVMTPDVSSGQPIIDNHGIRALVVWNRNQEGESVGELASDYGIKPSEVQAAISYISSIEHTHKAA